MAGARSVPGGGGVLAVADFSGEIDGPVPPPLSSRPFAPASPRPGPRLHTNEEFIEDLYADLPLDDVDAMFAWVFSELRPCVRVLPTENYYYFSFHCRGLWIWGNLRIGIEDRRGHSLHFTYWEFLDAPRSPGDSRTWSGRFGRGRGLALRKVSPLVWDATFRGRTVRFMLNDIVFRQPRSRPFIAKSEVLLGRTQDESGYHLFLVHHRRRRVFLWVLDLSGVPGVLRWVHRDELAADRLSGFLFARDAPSGRFVLIGVARAHIRRNNYWDGPFDQLPDNKVHPLLAACLHAAYPATRGRIDPRGIYLDAPGFRVSVSDYLDYDTIEEVIMVWSNWRRASPRSPVADFLALSLGRIRRRPGKPRPPSSGVSSGVKP